MSSVQRESLSDQVVRILLGRIQSKEWEIGEKLPSETTLAPQLGVGRSTVREAIRQLSGQGVLLTRQGSGVFVNALGPALDWDALVTRTNITSIIEARIAIECEAAALAARRHTDDDLLAIRKALERRGAGGLTINARVDTDTAFHRSVVVAGHNDLLTELFDTFAVRSRDAMIQMLELTGVPRTESDQRAHSTIVEAIAQRDSSAASVLSRTHLVSLRDGLAQNQKAPDAAKQ